MRRLLLCLFVFPLLTQAAESHVNPLLDKLWSPAQQRFIDWPEFYRHWLPMDGWLLLGEQHDNPDHHRWQARLIQELGERKVLGAVALEMSQARQQPVLDRVYADKLPPEQITPQRIEWSDGWPWSLYEAPVKAAFTWSERVLGTDLSRDDIHRLYSDYASVPDLEPAHAGFMLDLLYESHCGQLPREQLQPMRHIQLARDLRIASALRDNIRPGRVGVLLTGSIHARADLGVPRRLDTTPRLTLLMVALDADADADAAADPQSYLPESFGNLAPTDLILFTPARTPPDYCADLKMKSG